MTISFSERVAGALVGLAIGEAVGNGAPRRTHARKAPTSLIADSSATTQIILTLAETLTAADGHFDPEALLGELDAQEACGDIARQDIDIGLRTTIEIRRSTNAPITGLSFPDPIAALRVIPVTVMAATDQTTARFLAGEQCRMTHEDPDTLRAAIILSDGLRRILTSTPAEPKPIEEEELRMPATREMGAAVRHSMLARNFIEAVVIADRLKNRRLVLMVAGALAGARFGVEAMPSPWLSSISSRARLESAARALAEVDVSRPVAGYSA